MYYIVISLFCYGFNSVATSSPGQSCWETYKSNKGMENICHLLQEYVVCYLGELRGFYNETFENFLCQEVRLTTDPLQCLQHLQNKINERVDHSRRLQQVMKEVWLHEILLYVVIIILARFLIGINISVIVALSLFVVCVDVMNNLTVIVRNVDTTLNCG